MRCYIHCLCAALVACSALAACTAAPAPEKKAPEALVKPVEKPRSPHHVMVSLAGGVPMARDQQDYVIKLQEKIADRWQPVPARLKYSVGLEFTVTRPGLITSDVRAVSSMGTRKMIESCRDAILRADRFDPLPAQFKTSPQTFMCEFMYNPQEATTAAATPARTAPGQTDAASGQSKAAKGN
jgi:hypothetical protein